MSDHTLNKFRMIKLSYVFKGPEGVKLGTETDLKKMGLSPCPLSQTVNTLGIYKQADYKVENYIAIFGGRYFMRVGKEVMELGNVFPYIHINLLSLIFEPSNMETTLQTNTNLV